MTDFIAFETLIRSPKPNTCLVAPEGLCKNAQADFAPQTFPKAATALYDSVTQLISAERHWGKLLTDKDNLRLRFVAITPFMRFKDDVDIQIIASPETESATLAIYSRSRVGYSDFGANRKRIVKLLADLTRI